MGSEAADPWPRGGARLRRGLAGAGAGALWLAVLAGCGGSSPSPMASSTTRAGEVPGATEAGSGTSSGSGSSSGSSSSSSESSGDDTQGSSGGAELSCDIFADDCPEGQKCTWGGYPDGSFFEFTLCVPLDPDPLPDGSPCTYDLDDPFSGVDRCGPGAICAEGYVGDGAWDGEASCVSLCRGTIEHRYCEAGMACLGTRALWVCTPYCDPFAQDCGEGARCDLHGGEPLCGGDGPGELGPGEPCGWSHDCALGLSCLLGSSPGCEYGCCTPFCDRTDPQAECPFAGQVCVEPFEGYVPLGAEKVGVCLMGGE